MLGYTDQHRNEKENISIYIYVCNIIHVMTLEYTICVTQETLVEKKKRKKKRNYTHYYTALCNILETIILSN